MKIKLMIEWHYKFHIDRFTVKSKVYFYPKNWVVLPVIQMTQIMGYNTSSMIRLW